MAYINKNNALTRILPHFRQKRPQSSFFWQSTDQPRRKRVDIHLFISHAPPRHPLPPLSDVPPPLQGGTTAPIVPTDVPIQQLLPIKTKEDMDRRMQAAENKRKRVTGLRNAPLRSDVKHNRTSTDIPLQSRIVVWTNDYTKWDTLPQYLRDMLGPKILTDYNITIRSPQFEHKQHDYDAASIQTVNSQADLILIVYFNHSSMPFDFKSDATGTIGGTLLKFANPLKNNILIVIRNLEGTRDHLTPTTPTTDFKNRLAYFDLKIYDLYFTPTGDKLAENNPYNNEVTYDLVTDIIASATGDTETEFVFPTTATATAASTSSSVESTSI